MWRLLIVLTPIRGLFRSARGPVDDVTAWHPDDDQPSAVPSPDESGAILAYARVEAELEQRTHFIQQRVKRNAVGAIFLAIPFLAILQALGNLEAFPMTGGIRWRELLHDAHLSLERASDVTIALLAVEATLSIALAVVAPRPSDHRTFDIYVGAAAWASVAVPLAFLTSGLSLAVALTQWFTVDVREHIAETAVLTCTGLLTVGLYAAVTSYTGQDLFDNIQTRRSLAALRKDLSAWPADHRRQPQKRGYTAVTFCLAIGLISTLAILLIQLVDLPHQPHRFPWTVCSVRLPLPCWPGWSSA